MCRPYRPIIAMLLFLGGALAATAAPLAVGNDHVTLNVDGIAIEVFTYKPPHYNGGPLLITFAGYNRNASDYRDHTRIMGERFGLLVVAPMFDKQRFPAWRYQSAGMSREAKKQSRGKLTIEPRSKWTGTFVLKLVSLVRAREKQPDLPYYLIGHSAGAQLLDRIAAFMPLDAQRVVIANPSSYVFPTDGMIFPFGFGGLLPQLSGPAVIRRYLAQPITIFLGMADTVAAKHMDTRKLAMQQGSNRLERGRNIYRVAQRLARTNNWTFNWRLVEVPDVGHNARDVCQHADRRRLVHEIGQ